MAIEGVPVEKAGARRSKSRGPPRSRGVYDDESEDEADSGYRGDFQYERRSQPRSKDVRFRR